MPLVLSAALLIVPIRKALVERVTILPIARNRMQHGTGRRAVAVALLTVVALHACAPHATITDSWTSPATTRVDFEKVLVVAITQNEYIRREAEDAMARSIGRAQAVPSYDFLTVEELRTPTRIRSKLASEGFDGAVTLRLIGPEQQRDWLPGRYPDPYYDFWAYHDWTRGLDDTGYVQSDDKVRFETNVYDVVEGRLMWAGLSEGVRGGEAADLVDDVAEAVAKELRRKGLID
jgi:hypothetical protein